MLLGGRIWSEDACSWREGCTSLLGFFLYPFCFLTTMPWAHSGPLHHYLPTWSDNHASIETSKHCDLKKSLILYIMGMGHSILAVGTCLRHQTSKKKKWNWSMIVVLFCFNSWHIILTDQHFLWVLWHFFKSAYLCRLSLMYSRIMMFSY